MTFETPSKLAVSAGIGLVGALDWTAVSVSPGVDPGATGRAGFSGPSRWPFFAVTGAIERSAGDLSCRPELITTG